MFPKAPLYTLVHIPGSVPATIENREIHTSLLQRLPMSATKYRYYLPLFPLFAESLKIKGYDLVISTSHAVVKSVRTYGTPHWCYIHSPMRYVWDRFEDYFGADLVGRIPSQFFYSPIASYLRSYDRRTANRVGHYVANSQFVAKRVEDFYHRSAEVICPPVDVARFSNLERETEDFYLYFSALVPYKKADHAIRACQELERKLVVLGRGPELEKLKRMANPKWIQFADAKDDSRVNRFYQGAKALLFPGIEDFGIVPVEAMAAGLPVIAYKMGGVLDSLTEETAVFYESQTVESLKNAILKFESETSRFNVSVSRHQAGKFTKDRFRAKVERSIDEFLRKDQ
jgi:glycosyltransferase involved in cell wall biosynthesis